MRMLISIYQWILGQPALCLKRKQNRWYKHYHIGSQYPKIMDMVYNPLLIPLKVTLFWYYRSRLFYRHVERRRTLAKWFQDA